MDINKLIVSRIKSLQNIKTDQIPSLFQEAGIKYIRIENVNWPAAYPYCPQMELGIAHTGNAILLHYRVKEQSVRAVAQQDQDHIWEDSCAEFFCSPMADGLYYNFECNCTGKLLMAVGAGRTDREQAAASVMQQIDRWASLGNTPFDTRKEETVWEIALRIPVTAFFRHNIKNLSGLRMTGNFYKCGDKLPVPHFISWNPITTDKPDFHRPEYFGMLEFA